MGEFLGIATSLPIGRELASLQHAQNLHILSEGVVSFAGNRLVLMHFTKSGALARHAPAQPPSLAGNDCW